VIDPTLPGTFTFYQKAELNGNVVYSDQHMITVTCGLDSTTLTAPAILTPLPGNAWYRVYSPASTYTLLSTFTNTNSNCGVTSHQINQISSGGVASDKQNQAGQSITISSSASAAPVAQLPAITTVFRGFKFRIRALC
jgi:hypothetical protein